MLLTALLCFSCFSTSPDTSVEMKDLELIQAIQRVDAICTKLCGAPPDEFGIEPGHEDCQCPDGRSILLDSRNYD